LKCDNADAETLLLSTKNDDHNHFNWSLAIATMQSPCSIR
jgi:hypothetical protein